MKKKSLFAGIIAVCMLAAASIGVNAETVNFSGPSNGTSAFTTVNCSITTNRPASGGYIVEASAKQVVGNKPTIVIDCALYLTTGGRRTASFSTVEYVPGTAPPVYKATGSDGWYNANECRNVVASVYYYEATLGSWTGSGSANF